MQAVSTGQKADFLEVLWAYYAKSGRHDLPWRVVAPDGGIEPYYVLVSELMLQQTQVPRVIPKYVAFLEQFPTVHSLASAELGAVLTAWQGLGYNRRAKYLWQAARDIVDGGSFPAELDGLVALPGVGANTAGAILAYAYNKPAVFIETNIRTVYIHHFFSDAEAVDDKDIRALLEQTLDTEHPREFYWALMDYGSWLKTQTRNIAQSKHYTRQSEFKGSRRQVRGMVIRELSSQPATLYQLQQRIPDERLRSVLDDLQQEGLIRADRDIYRLA